MSDPRYSYATQNNFTGGIATEPELRKVSKAGEVTVAEAADVWAPNGVLKRRPGVVNYTNVVVGDLSATSSPASSSLIGTAVFQSAAGVAFYAQASGSDVVITGVTPTTAGVLYIPIPTTQMGFDWSYSAYGGFTPSPTTPTILWVPPGGDVLLDRQFIDNGLGSIVTAGSSGTVSSGQLWASYIIPSAPATITLFSAAGSASNGIFYYSNLAPTILGATYSPLPSGEVYLSLRDDSGAAVRCSYANTVNSLTGNAGTVNTSNGLDLSLYTTTGSPPSWSTVVDANRVYAAYANQVYEYRPELATRFRLAQVNSNPIIVGPGATYDQTIFAQWPVFPKANQVIYFNGLLFFTDIKGNPNVVQWGGPAIDGAVDVLPVLSYAILTDSRDNSQNVGFGVYNSNLYVFKRNSIWALIPAGQSEVDGSYLFTSRLVTSGAGCSAPGSIVSTPQGIIFYNQGGFYIFNGQKTEKLTNPIKELFDAIVPGNAYQMSAAHWPQQHSYVATCQMTHPWPSDVFEGLASVFTGTLGYDYQNDAWWLWLTVSGKAVFMDNYGNFITQSYYNEFRILDPNKEYDSDALAKSAAQPYIKTQRFGYGESLQKKYRELRATGEIDNLDIETSVEINDQLLAATDYDMTFIPVDYAEIPLGTTIPNDDPYSPPWGRREVRVAIQDDGQWAQVRLNGNYGPFTVYNINLGYFVDGRNG